MQLAHPGLRHHVTNRAGTTYAQRNSDVLGRVDHLFATAPYTVLIDDGGSYDIEAGNGNMNATQALAAKAAYTAARRAAGADYIVGLTIPPATILTAGEETTRLAVNAAMKANPSAYGYNQVVDIAGIPQLQNPNDTNFYFDGVHWTTAGTSIVADALVAANI